MFFCRRTCPRVVVTATAILYGTVRRRQAQPYTMLSVAVALQIRIRHLPCTTYGSLC
jgi:hypothetical protein